VKDLSLLNYNLIAHRGLHNKDIPENSLKAFDLAIKKNYIIELDIHILKDNTIIVFHDDNIKRMTGINRNIKDCTYEEIKKYNLLNTKYKIPKLEDVLKLVDGKVPLIIELKTDVKPDRLEKNVVKLLDDYKGLFCVKSFNILSIKWFKKNRNNYIRGLLVDKNWNNILKIISFKPIINLICKPDFISCNCKLVNDKKIKKFKKNIPIISWTIKNKTNYIKYKDKYDNLICENIDDYL
jgi:glycerophosphoryl diester phosphodiesterase